jgi:hypothetical protein
MFRILSRITSNHGVTCIAAQHDHVTVTMSQALAGELADALEHHRPFHHTVYGGSVVVLIPPQAEGDALRLLWYAPASLEPVTLWSLADTPSHRAILAQALRDPRRTGDVNMRRMGALDSGSIRLHFAAPLADVLRVAAEPSDNRRWVPGQVWGVDRWADVNDYGAWEAVLACTSGVGLVYEVALTWADLTVAQDMLDDDLYFFGVTPTSRHEINTQVALEVRAATAQAAQQQVLVETWAAEERTFAAGGHTIWAMTPAEERAADADASGQAHQAAQS